MFEPLQSQFAGALLDADRALPEGVTSHTAAKPERRFAIYRNNVVVGLIEAIESRFPVVKRLVGDDFFRAMARVFVTAYPPHSPLPMVYGDEFPDFIAGFEPAADIPYLADVARLEALRTKAYHAADASCLDPSAFAALDPARLGELRVKLHPSVSILRSAYPIVTIWAMNAGEMVLAPIEDWRDEDALVSRPLYEVFVQTLPSGGATFLTSLWEGRTLAVAAAAGFADTGAFDLAFNLAGLIGSNIVVDITP
jgi:hypothetical protein